MSIMSLLKNIMYDVEWWVWVILTDLMQKIHMSAGALRIHKPLGPSTQSKSLRLLLKHVKGAKSFAELRTIPEINQTFDTMLFHCRRVRREPNDLNVLEFKPRNPCVLVHCRLGKQCDGPVPACLMSLVSHRCKEKARLITIVDIVKLEV
ncbi:hypothetical protein BX616_004401, partial [Lobosporangium transversale]